MRIRKYAARRELYATYRMSRAVDRMIVANSTEAKQQARLWAAAWGIASGTAVPTNTI